MKIQFLYPLCLRCGSLAVRCSLFCRNCENDFLLPRLRKQKRTLDVDGDTYPVDFLLHWIPNESDCLSELVYLLKSPLSYSVWKFYVEKFCQLDHQLKNQKNTATVIIPIPGSHLKKTAYHTMYFAQSWQKCSPGVTLSCLTSQPKPSEQKDLSLGERSQVQVSFIEDFTNEIYKYEHIILIDDIVTSGHTIQASLMALKPYLRPGCVVEIKALLSRGKI